jgi:hypothetical protein
MANNDIHSKVYEMGVAITDIGRLIQSFALFIHKILASLITGGKRSIGGTLVDLPIFLDN